MGLPAVRTDVAHRVRPRLALVPKTRSKTRRGGGVPKACHSARCRESFTVFVVVAVLFSGLGVARVALASRAAAISIESGMMRARVKEARFQGDMLEIKLSQLSTPSRIRGIAGKKMRMAPAGLIWYMTIDGAKQGAGKAQGKAQNKTGKTDFVATQKSTGRAGGNLLSSIMHTAAGEAQVLLLGDVGLASSR